MRVWQDAIYFWVAATRIPSSLSSSSSSSSSSSLMMAMSSSAEPVVVVLDDTHRYSVTYNPPDDAVTANLPHALPIEKVSNKRKLMLLIYFAQRDLFSTHHAPRKIDAHTTVEQR